ncbi:MAG: hypothetical protein A2Z04_01000 [Chloroflexi bacterium RBG_16_57_9]|nr:MAG: hypothetical protein A2Z04_01000 [Chloroflexi bacterium RBG_16_57_9]
MGVTLIIDPSREGWKATSTNPIKVILECSNNILGIGVNAPPLLPITGADHARPQSISPLDILAHTSRTMLNLIAGLNR